MISTMTRGKGPSKRPRGLIQELPSGSLRVSVFAGRDPVTKKKFYLRETVPAGPRAAKEAEKIRVRLLNEIYERRNPRTDATVAQLVERHLKEAELDDSTLSTYQGYVRKHIVPLLGTTKVRALGADVLDSFYVELRRCRDHCRGSGEIDHRTDHPHECNERCRPHTCKPLSASATRQLHWILSGALRRAVRWQWISVNPAANAEPPAPPRSNPRPPTAEEAACLVNEAWRDPDWGTLVWLTMVTGIRRGELCALRWRSVDLDGGVLHLENSIGQRGSRVWEKSTKSHQDRRIFLDPDSIELLRRHRAQFESRAEALGVSMDSDAFVFSLAPDGSTHLRPDSVTSRYNGMARRLGIKTTIHKLRHYSATELIMAGVNVRTVAGRLGHSGGGTTTLRTYTAWVSEADQRAAGSLAARMPPRPTPSVPEPVEADGSVRPYRKIADDLHRKITDGSLPAGLPLPSLKKLSAEYSVAVGTAQRAVGQLAEWGLVEVMAGRTTLVKHQAAPGVETGELSSVQLPGEPAPAVDVPVAKGHGDSLAPTLSAGERQRPLDLEVRRIGAMVATLRTNAGPTDAAVLHRLLAGAVKRDGAQPDAIDEYELIVRCSGEPSVMTTYVAASP